MSSEIRNLDRAQLAEVLRWAEAEAWNPGRDDLHAFWQADPSGYFGAFVAGHMAASISAVKYGSSFAFVGLYIATPRFRGQGHGMVVWRAALASVEDRRVGLDGVVAQQHNYRKSGFVYAHANLRYSGTARAAAPRTGILSGLGEGVDFDALVAFDRHHVADAREAFLRAWIDQPDAHLRVAIDGATIRGYGVIRPSADGYRIGPLFADNESDAGSLFQALLAAVPAGSVVAIDVPQPNASALRMVESARFTPGFETARMCLRGDPMLPLAQIYGITSLELG